MGDAEAMTEELDRRVGSGHGAAGGDGVAPTGIILAGGRSSRFGAQKLDAHFAEGSVLEATTSALQGVVGEIVVVGPAAEPGTLERLGLEGLADAHHVRAVRDDDAFAGPLAGLRHGLAAAAAAKVVVVGGDMPLVRADVLRSLLDRLDRPIHCEVVTLEVEPAHPLPMAVRRAPALRAADALLRRGERSLRALVSALAGAPLPEREWRLLDPEGDSLLDIDRPEDLEAARARWRARQ